MEIAAKVLSASVVLGKSVKSSRDEDLGKVEELIIDPHTGRIVGALLSRADGIKRPDGLAAIPWSALTLADGVIYADADIIKYPRRRERDWPDTGVPRWLRNVVVYTSSIYKRGSN